MVAVPFVPTRNVSVNPPKRMQHTYFWALVLGLVTVTGTVPHNEARAQPMSRIQQTMHHYVRQMADETPSRATQQRIRQYEPYIQYVAELSFTRPGVTVNANFLRALMAAESGGRANAVSGKGAVGLLQLLPETARRAARALYDTGHTFRYVRRSQLRNVTARDLKNPALNILIGGYLLDRYNQRFGNDLAHTVSAWNAGPERVQQYRGAPPYRETLTLIGRVNAYYQYFLRIRRP